jgi:hypothetical protein
MADISTTLTIPSGGANSPELTASASFDLLALMVAAPAGLVETVTLQIGDKPGGTFYDIRSNGTDINFAAGKADMLTVIPGSILRMHSSGNVAADRVFRLWAGDVGT